MSTSRFVSKIKVDNPVVEMDGDEMTRIIWAVHQGQADPALPRRRAGVLRPRRSSTATRPTTRSRSTRPTRSSSTASRVKCATITPDEARVEEFGLKKMWRSPERHDPQHPRRRRLPRADHHARTSRGSCPGWTKPIVIGRHAHGDQYKATDFKVPGAGTVTITYTPADGGEPMEFEVAEFGADGGVAMGMYNFDDSIRDFARASLRYGLDRNYPVYLSTKNTILKAYDGRFKDLFEEVFDDRVQGRLRRRRPHLRAPPDRRHGRRGDEVGGRLRVGVQELRRRRAVRHRGAGLRLARPDDVGADDARRQDGRGRGGARHRHPPLPRAPEGQQDVDQPDRVDLRLDRRPRSTAASSTARPTSSAFAETLEQVCVEAVEAGEMTKDLALLISRRRPCLTTEEFLDALDAPPEERLAVGRGVDDRARRVDAARRGPQLVVRRWMIVRLWPVRIHCHSARTLSSPRRRNRPMRRFVLMSPNTGSMIALRCR